jgi:Anti-sigma-D factor RsdA to sigma factor binding region
VSSRDDDLSQIAADDALLDALGRGEPAPDGDALAGLLHAWRADLDTHLDTHLDADQPLVGELLEAETHRPIELNSRRRPSRLLTGIAAAILVFGGLAAGASQAGPDSPLWPITKVMYPEQADTRGAERAIANARAALAANRTDEATHQLDVAQTLVGRLHDGDDKKRLTDQIAQLRQLIVARVTPPAIPSPSVGPVPGGTPDTPAGPTQQPVPPPTPGPQPTRNGGNGGNNPGLPLPTGGGLPLPTLPGLPPPTLPSLPLPSIKVPIPPILPS